ncbi:hypothetical protein HOD08_05325 [bacterium]|jgi:hypothetical protein|nr:hypothetical protein [bacterium]
MLKKVLIAIAGIFVFASANSGLLEGVQFCRNGAEFNKGIVVAELVEQFEQFSFRGENKGGELTILSPSKFAEDILALLPKSGMCSCKNGKCCVGCALETIAIFVECKGALKSIRHDNPMFFVDVFCHLDSDVMHDLFKALGSLPASSANFAYDDDEWKEVCEMKHAIKSSLPGGVYEARSPQTY